MEVLSFLFWESVLYWRSITGRGKTGSPLDLPRQGGLPLKKLYLIMRPPADADARLRRAHRVWLTLALTGMGCCVGGLSLFFSASAYVRLNGWAMCYSYLTNPLILVLNLLPPVLLIWLFYFLFRRAWVGFTASYLLTIGVALVNYYKIRLRGDPFLAVDLRLAAEAGGIAGRYTLDLTPLVLFGLLCFAGGLLFSVFLMPGGPRDWRRRAVGALSCLALMGASFAGLYTSPRIYDMTANERFINKWSDVEVFLSKGCVYPFLYSVRDMFPDPPEGYDREWTAAEFAQYEDSDIPEGKKVSVMGVMLEAFCDLTDFEAMGEKVAEVYAPWHALEEQSVSGDLLTNIFAGGTVDTEWAFLTGFSQHDEFRSPVDSYVWYFRNQGYRTYGGHPGYGWFYNRQNVNQYLGFEEYWFHENHYEIDPSVAVWDSDLEVAKEMAEQLKDGNGPSFSFYVTYQNHGPYSLEPATRGEYVTPAGTGMSEESCNILNNYLGGVSTTIQAMTGLAQDLEELDEPVVLVIFGDHKPWLGNGDSAYIEMGVDFNLETPEGFRNYFSAPYLIWANSAAKEALGNDFTGDGGDFSPCFLMPKVFDLCAWEGPGFMTLSREVRDITPLVHAQGLFWVDGAPVDALDEAGREACRRYRWIEYYREHSAAP